MRFQSVKCNMMTLSRKKKTIEYKYTLKGTELEFLTSIKYLGVSITNDLHWGKHKYVANPIEFLLVVLILSV
jgi:hypothetical protein